MAAILDLTAKPRRTPGLTNRNSYASLHGKALQAKQEPTSDDINAPPKGSSDEESDSPAEANKDKEERGNKSSVARELRNRAESSSPNREVALNNTKTCRHPADIRSTVFTSSIGSQSRNGSQEVKRRQTDVHEDEDEDDMMGSFNQSQPRKRRKEYHSQNIHLAPSASAPKKKKEGASGGSIAGRHELKKLPAIAKLDEQEAAYKKATLRTLSSTETTSRSARASQRLSRTIQDSSQNTPKKVFRKLPKISPPKDMPQFKILGYPAREANIGTSTRPVASSETRRGSNDSKQLDTAAISDAVHVAVEKLGMSDIQFKHPPSLTTMSSLPSDSFDGIGTSSPLSSPPLDMEIIEVSPMQKNVEYVAHALVSAKEHSAPRCPLCKEKVDSLFFDEYTGGRRLTIRQQAEFCKAYKKHMADTEWRNQSFPEIQWQCLDERLKKYHDSLDDILQGKRFSFYRNVYEDSVKSGKDKMLRKTLMNGEEFGELTPGYYGSRGAKIMAENIMTRFASKIRRLAPKDRLISSGGVSGYVHAVLVPELGLLLIKDDMSIDEEKAREVLSNSADIGNLLNEEEDEIITDPIENVGVIEDLT